MVIGQFSRSVGALLSDAAPCTLGGVPCASVSTGSADLFQQLQHNTMSAQRQHRALQPDEECDG
jgi:hypothetical protein